MSEFRHESFIVLKGLPCFFLWYYGLSKQTTRGVAGCLPAVYL